VAARTPGLAGADLANLVNEAALLAARRGKERVERSDLDEAVDRVIAGMEKRSRLINPLEKETVAFHEAGHALVAEFRAHADRVAKVSIIPRGIAALGYTQQLPTEDRYLLKKSELLDRMDVLLGGRVAEELVFGDCLTGAQNDLQMATDLARHMVTQYGMSERLGLATFEQAAAARRMPRRRPAPRLQRAHRAPDRCRNRPPAGRSPRARARDPARTAATARRVGPPVAAARNRRTRRAAGAGAGARGAHCRRTGHGAGGGAGGGQTVRTVIGTRPGAAWRRFVQAVTVAGAARVAPNRSRTASTTRRGATPARHAWWPSGHVLL
jgi:hypothetical protein